MGYSEMKRRLIYPKSIIGGVFSGVHPASSTGIGRKWKEIIDVTDKISYSFHVCYIVRLMSVALGCLNSLHHFPGVLLDDARRERSAKFDILYEAPHIILLIMFLFPVPKILCENLLPV